ncbi:hypothetical protein APZ41_009720 [Roseomonas mucosa]|jgi:hypothetical protein|uniref:Lipoprotein n=2 Tax=Roseomonas mucosa TaxID=207340 RepID=A0A1S8D663_9PROT|nr:hypothetical protein APZ41_009720 [Roseomonas mucosa]
MRMTAFRLPLLGLILMATALGGCVQVVAPDPYAYGAPGSAAAAGAAAGAALGAAIDASRPPPAYGSYPAPAVPPYPGRAYAY